MCLNLGQMVILTRKIMINQSPVHWGVPIWRKPWLELECLTELILDTLQESCLLTGYTVFIRFMATQIHHLWSQRLGDNKLLAHPGTYFVLSRNHRRERKELDSFLPKGSDHIAHGGGTFGNGNWCPLPAGFLAKLGGCINLAFGFAKQCKGRSKTTCLKYTWGHAPGQKWCWWGYRCMASQEETGPQQFSTATKSPGKEQ